MKQNNQQRPTPETDDAVRKGAYLTHGEYPETCGKQIVLNFIVHGAFQFGAAWQRMDTNEKFNLTTKTIQKP